ncbi:MAG TPA: cell division ATP-binding protein FtsE [Clostridiaceae bacterium]|nr:cell division ATP-binding protein FtsE [Clostridiaceae bacterium]
MIELVDAVKVYKNGVTALDHVSFSVEPGEFVFVVGESGAGKSTLIKLLTCEERVNSGVVFLDGYDLAKLPRRLVPFLRRRVGMIFQDFRLIEGKTVFENVAFAMEIIGTQPEKIKRRVPLVLSQVGLRTKMNMYTDELSGGEAQRLGIARAIVNNPSLILADEPTGNLDPSNGEAIMALLECVNQEGTTVIACTHDKSLVDRMTKRVVEFSNGKLIRDACHSTYSETFSCSDDPGRYSVKPGEIPDEFDDREQSAGNIAQNVQIRIPQVKEIEKYMLDSHKHRTNRRLGRQKYYDETCQQDSGEEY